MKFIPVDDHLKLKDSTNEIDIYHIVGNYHMADGVIVRPGVEPARRGGSHHAGVGLQLVGRQPDEQHRECRKIKVETNLAVHAQKPYPLAEVVSAIEKQVRNTQAFCRRAAEAQFFQPGCPIQYAQTAAAELRDRINWNTPMRSLCALSAAVVVACVVVTAPARQRSAGRFSQDGPLALVGGTLIDGTGSAPVRNSVVLIRGERIEKIRTTISLPVPDGYEAVSTEGLTVLPGLWDLHVHLICAGHPMRATGSPRTATVRTGHHSRVGTTTTDGRCDNCSRSCSAAAADPRRQEAHRYWRDPGPTLYVAGPALTKGGNPNAVQTWNVSGAADAERRPTN